MIQVSSCGAKVLAPRVEPRGWFDKLNSGRGFAVAALMMLGCATLSSGAYAQSSTGPAAASSEACEASCKTDHDKCIADQSSEELCAYELKGCKATCQKK